MEWVKAKIEDNVVTRSNLVKKKLSLAEGQSKNDLTLQGFLVWDS